MKNYIVIVIALFSFGTFAQRDLTPGKKKKDAFGGARDFRNLSNTGLQFQLGPTYMFTRNKLNEDTLNPLLTGYRGNYSFDPDGKIGVYGEIGLFHFPKEENLFSLIVSYYDWGLGFKYFRGSEGIYLDRTDALGNVVSEEDITYKFSHGNVFGRFSLHKNIYFAKGWSFDNSLGLNFDYRLIQNSDEYQWSPMTADASYYKNFYSQLHYGLAVQHRIKRGSYISVGARTPILGYQSFTPNQDGSGDKDHRFGNPAFNWFTSKYWPIMFHVKYMFLFEKKVKGCKGAEIYEKDAERYRNGN